MKKSKYACLGFAKIDIDRKRRCGFEEVIYSPGKTVSQLTEICNFFFRANRTLVLTRLEEQIFSQLKAALPKLAYDKLAKVAFFLPPKVKSKKRFKRQVLVISAGMSDMPSAQEAFVVLKVLGIPVKRLYDVGVAGLERLLANRKKLRQASCIIVVAGMDAALASIVSGLVKVPVIAVPTSCGYGAHFKGLASLLSMLNCCAPGLGVVNIDNGFGAAILAAKIIRL